MIVLPLVVVVAIVGVVVASRHRHAHAMSTGGSPESPPHAPPVTQLGRWSLIVLGAGLLLWLLTRTTLPIYYAASVGGVAFLLAIVAGVRSHDRSPLLLIPLLFVPLAAAAGAAFVLLQ